MPETSQYIDKAIDLAMTYGPKLLLALVVLFIGSRAIRLISKTFEGVLARKNFDTTLRPFLVALLSWTLKVLLFISVAQMVGIATTSFVAVLGASSLAIGLALQGSLANFAGGVLILILRPFNIGDFISAQGEEGVVEKIDIFATIINKVDNQKVILPNGPLAGGTIVNLTGQSTRRVDLSVGVGYSDDLSKAISSLEKMCSDNKRVLNNPQPPFVGITEYGDNSINLTIRSWVNTADYWDAFFELNRQIKPTLDAAGISIPFPQRDVHLHNSGAQG